MFKTKSYVENVSKKGAIRYMVGIKSIKSCKEYSKDLKIMTIPAIYIYETILCIKHDNVKRDANFHE
jgi:hypothetical protein